MTDFDEIRDVVVVGCGYAGAMSAIAAHDAGADVLVLEKGPRPGGISICSAGGLRIAADEASALRYLTRTNGGATPEAPLRALARGMTGLADAVDRLAEGTGAVVGRRALPGNYPFDGSDTFGFVYIEALPDFDAARDAPDVRGSPEGARLFTLMRRNLERRGIEVRVSTRASRLIRDGDSAVAGVVVEAEGARRRIDARRAVILACGGFEGDAEMQRQFWEAGPALSAAYRLNTGDGVRMAQAAGAALWHMWHYHGSYGFRHPDPAYPFAIRTKRVPDWRPGTPPPADVKMPWILVDKAARRFMNEYQPYLQDTGARGLGRLRPERQDHAGIPAILVADEDGRGLYPFGRPTWHEAGVGYEWSADNSREIANGMLRQAGTLDDLAAKAGLDAARLKAEIERWNCACAAGADADFERPAGSMLPIRRPPFVFAEIWPVVSNTQGGPVRDEGQRVLDAFGVPIPRLYSAGEMGSVFGHLYMSGGNLAECFIGGAIAGRAAASLGPGIMEESA